MNDNFSKLLQKLPEIIKETQSHNQTLTNHQSHPYTPFNSNQGPFSPVPTQQDYQNNMNRQPNNQGQLFCRYCKRTNHTIENCFAKARSDQYRQTHQNTRPPQNQNQSNPQYNTRNQRNWQRPNLRNTTQRQQQPFQDEGSTQTDNTRVTFNPKVNHLNTIMSTNDGQIVNFSPTNDIEIPMHSHKNSNSYAIEITIDKRNYSALIDSGASSSVISHKFKNSDPTLSELKTTASDSNLQTANAQTLKTFGSLLIQFSVEKYSLTQPFLVVEGLSTPIILGQDFLLKYGTVINFISKTIILKIPHNTLLELPSPDIHQTIKQNPTYKGRVFHTTKLPPFSKSKITIVPPPNLNGPYNMNTHPTFKEKYPFIFLVPHQNLTRPPSLSKTFVINNSPQPFILHSHTAIATYIPTTYQQNIENPNCALITNDTEKKNRMKKLTKMILTKQ